LRPFEREWQREFSYLDATLLTLVLATVRAAGDNAVVMSTRPVIPHRNEFPYFRPMMTRWLDNDAYGHINNVVYYEYFDTTVNAFLIEATGTDTRSLAQIGIVAETGCVFHSSLSFPQPLEIGLAVERLGRSSVTYRLGARCRMGGGYRQIRACLRRCALAPTRRNTRADPRCIGTAKSAVSLGVSAERVRVD
jgi:acyl-CoA thioesterase FadM